MPIDRYLARIGYTGPREPTAGALAAIHLAHMRAVPFENLDIALGLPIRLEPAPLYDKIVGRKRGGYCFELNGLFGRLLKELGYPVSLLAARVFRGAEPGPDFDHALLLIDGPTPLIADVGFGDSFLTPLPLVRGREETQHGAAYRLSGDGAAWRLEQRLPGADWKPQYLFGLAATTLEAFIPMSDHLSTSPDSPFTRKAVCSAPTADGRVTLSGNRLIVTARGERTVHPVPNAAEYRRLLRQHFRLELPEEAAIDRLLALNPPPD